MNSTEMGTLGNRTAIVGLGATELSRNSERSELQLAVETVTAAMTDAGIPIEELDGRCAFTMDNNTESEVFRSIGGKDLKLAAGQLYAMSELGPQGVQAAIVYDHFLPSIPPGLEAYGFCGRGEGKDFIKGGAIEIGGRLPLNINGGQVGEAYVHGSNGIAEGVRQVRGTAVNQVANVENILITSGSGVLTSGLILGTA